MNLVKRSWIAIPFAFALLWACNGTYPGSQEAKAPAADQQNDIASKENKDQYFNTTDSVAQVAGNDQENNNKDQGQPPRNIDWDKKIVKNASITLEINDYHKYDNLLHNTISQFGGYIAQEDQNESSYKIENAITIKVPVDQFEKAISFITPDSGKVIVKKITSEDVTGQLVDTKSRIEAKKEVRDRYMELLRQAKNMKDILAVQNEINNVQEEIESAGGRVNYLSHASAFSTIQLNFYQVLNPQAIDTKDPGFGEKVLNALKNGFNWIGDLILLVLTIWPLWLVIGLAWWAVKRWKPAAKPVTIEQNVAPVEK